MNKRTLTSLLALTLGWAGSTGTVRYPVTGSGRPDAFARPGQTLTLPGARPIRIPDLPPGRAVLPVRGGIFTGGRVEVSVLPPVAGGVVLANITQPGVQQPRTSVLPDRVQVLLNPGLNPDALARALRHLGTYGRVTWETLPAPASSQAPINTRAVIPPSPCSGTLVEITLSGKMSLEDALNRLLAEDTDVIWYPDPISVAGHPQGLAQALPAPPAPRTPAALQRPRFFYPAKLVSSGISALPALGAGANGQGGAGVTIAVLDTGYSRSLDTLNELPPRRLLPPMNALAPFHQTASFTGYDDFWEGHGTQVAILAAGGQHGTAPQAKVLPIKVCADVAGRATCRTKDVLRGICFALNQVPPSQLVMNLSLGGAVPTDAIHATLKWAESQGAVIVAAGGNQGLNGNPREYPAAFTQTAGTQLGLELLAVESVTPTAVRSSPTIRVAQTWERSTFSTQGNYLNISAPGEALDIGHPYLYSGTSFAAPLVAGAAARVKGANLNVRMGTQGGGVTLPSVTQTITVRAFMLDPARTNSFVQPGAKPMLNLSGY
ncbi:hypothetical protein GCM10008959_33560 [Deinococcus seoulensis]|uniref:Peptidase S8/S53 domain-containing protein n=1 Tax=Deinococcus seoulensis TaxID=1837379 RepID=A0ABQ2RUZ7_9DEIO|nr:S8 family serine peptidase [Deinococcus seoulensis]GGR68790.1 hypothetical protein GCM10008959_33560 [Deinococcus seoulensis]